MPFEGGPDGFAEKALRLVVAWSQNPSGWRSHRRQLLGIRLLLRNPDTFSDRAGEVAPPIAEKCRGHPRRRLVPPPRASMFNAVGVTRLQAIGY